MRSFLLLCLQFLFVFDAGPSACVFPFCLPLFASEMSSILTLWFIACANIAVSLLDDDPHNVRHGFCVGARVAGVFGP